jgi:hypothetical protein
MRQNHKVLQIRQDCGSFAVEHLLSFAVSVCAQNDKIMSQYIPHPIGTVTIEFDGRLISATYSVLNGVITVTTPYGRKTSLVVGMRSNSAIKFFATRLLLDLAVDGGAEP